MSLLIRNCRVGKVETDIFVERGRIRKMGRVRVNAEKVMDATGMAALPGFINTHTHAAMTLFRGWVDDLKLDEWLGERIWPMEAHLTPELVYWGTKLACLEMIRSGTTTFVDMYFYPESAGKAVEEIGMRAFIGPVFLDKVTGRPPEIGIRKAGETLDMVSGMGENIYPVLCPHAVYTCTRETLQWCADRSKDTGIPVHFHLLETERENRDFRTANGLDITDLLEKIGFLHDRLVAAHCSWADEKDMRMLGENRVNVSFNPVSNMKLAVGRTMDAPAMERMGVNVCLGTDGPASNNSLSMLDTMKFAGLSVKNQFRDPTLCDADTLLGYATSNGARALSLDAGSLEVGKLADIILVDLSHESMVPSRNSLGSRMAYGASTEAIRHVICNGRIIMEDRKVKGAGEIVEGFERAVVEWFRKYEK